VTTRLDDRVALVTGAGRGLGRSHALHLASLGATVVVNDPGGALDGTGWDRSVADDVVAQIKARGGRAFASYRDVSDPVGAEAAVAEAVAAYGCLDILVCSAGNLRDRTFGKVAWSDFDAVVRTHLLGSAACAHAAWPGMMRARYGRIVFTTSAAGLYGNFGQSAYAAAKMGLLGLMQVLRLEGMRYGINVNAIAPIARTRMTRDLLDPAIRDGLDPELVSPVVAYLCSEDCALSGEVVAAAAGAFAAVAVVEAPGYAFEPGAEITPDTLAGRLAQITDLTHATRFGSAADAGAKVEGLARRRVAIQSPAASASS
jgi:NAD(P)-dependent dehydrogenase (short-subunit alcohol dehydrogenase family)